MTPVPGPRRGRTGRTRYLEVCDLGSEKCRLCASYFFARFYEASGTSACNVRTYDPVETKHPQNVTKDTITEVIWIDGNDQLLAPRLSHPPRPK